MWVTTLIRCHGGPHLFTHANAPLTPAGRLKLVELVVDSDWAQARVAERLQVSRATVSKWVRRYRADGLAGLADRSSKPHRSPSQTVRWPCPR